MENEITEPGVQKQFRFMLADDDADDRFFFEKAIGTIFPHTEISFVTDGEKLFTFLEEHLNELPDVIFLDLNMPRKNGTECLRHIRANRNYDEIAIVIYTTLSNELMEENNTVGDNLYEEGAHYYIRKPDLHKLSRILQHILNLLREGNLKRPEKELFILHLLEDSE